MLLCYHHYCKTCLDDILNFQGESAIIECPQRCTEVTQIGVDETTNNLRVSYDFKNIVEAVKTSNLEEIKARRCCQYENCEKEIAFFCCGNELCKQCSPIHQSDQQLHTPTPVVFMKERGDTLNILCEEHMTECSNYCNTDDRFICIYCTNRGHKDHQIFTVEERSSFMEEEFEKKREYVNASKSISHREFIVNKNNLDEVLKQRKLVCLVEYIDFLNEEESAIKKDFVNKYRDNIKDYPLTISSDDLSQDNIVGSLLQRTESLASHLKNMTLTLTDDFTFRGEHPLGKLNFAHSEDRSFAHPPTTTFKTNIGTIFKFIIFKFRSFLLHIASLQIK